MDHLGWRAGDADFGLVLISSPSAGGAIVGAVIGGILGHQIGSGRGRDVADWLARQPASCPVIVHSSNRDGAVHGMTNDK